MTRNARSQNDLHDERDIPSGPPDAAPAPPPFTFTPLGPDPSMGWAGSGSGAMAGWTQAQAAAELRRGDVDEHDRTRREPRE